MERIVLLILLLLQAPAQERGCGMWREVEEEKPTIQPLLWNWWWKENHNQNQNQNPIKKLYKKKLPKKKKKSFHFSPKSFPSLFIP